LKEWGPIIVRGKNTGISIQKEESQPRGGGGRFPHHLPKIRYEGELIGIQSLQFVMSCHSKSKIKKSLSGLLRLCEKAITKKDGWKGLLVPPSEGGSKSSERKTLDALP